MTSPATPVQSIPIDDTTAPTTQLSGLVADAPQPQPQPWTYEQGDPAIMLFTAAMQRFNFTFRPHSRILELGCAETDWLERMHRWDPTFDLVGVDHRIEAHRVAEGCPIVQGSAMDPDLFPPESFDWIVMLGALEHFGLGFYGDPIDEDGDTKTMENVVRWLRPGGLVYFDVPAQPTYRVAENRHFRMYGPGTITMRLLRNWRLREVNRAYSLPEPHAGTWCQEPVVERVPYWFVAVLAEKVA